MVRVSVVIPTFNRAELLRRALSSVFGQTRPADEVIVVDDGSEDETSAIVPADYPQVRYLRQPRAGVSAARNSGIRCATGEWIALLDSDDEWRPRKLELQLGALAQQPSYRICHTDEIWIRRGRRVNPMKKHAKAGGWIFRRCLPLCCISPSSVLIERSLFDEVGLFDASLPACEDYDLWLRISARHPVLFVEQPLLRKYGGHSDQLSRRYWGMDRFRICALEKTLAQSDSPLDPVDRDAARAMLLQKISLYLAGAVKRGRHDEASVYREKFRQWSAPE